MDFNQTYQEETRKNNQIVHEEELTADRKHEEEGVHTKKHWDLEKLIGPECEIGDCTHPSGWKCST